MTALETLIRAVVDEHGWQSIELAIQPDHVHLFIMLAKEYPFANKLNSMARQAAADRAWFAIDRFYENCKNHKPGMNIFWNGEDKKACQHVMMLIS